MLTELLNSQTWMWFQPDKCLCHCHDLDCNAASHHCIDTTCFLECFVPECAMNAQAFCICVAEVFACESFFYLHTDDNQILPSSASIECDDDRKGNLKKMMFIPHQDDASQSAYLLDDVFCLTHPRVAYLQLSTFSSVRSLGNGCFISALILRYVHALQILILCYIRGK